MKTEKGNFIRITYGIEKEKYAFHFFPFYIFFLVLLSFLSIAC